MNIKILQKQHYAQEIKNDFELQDWLNDVATEGVGWIDGNTKGVPKEVTTFEQLVFNKTTYSIQTKSDNPNILGLC